MVLANPSHVEMQRARGVKLKGPDCDAPLPRLKAGAKI
jgi:hypothetical protein